MSTPKFNEDDPITPTSPSPSEGSAASYTRHDSLWFVDGSIIIQAETTLFRVHMSQLSRHSTFFRDLFSLPQPPHLQNVTESQSQSETQFPVNGDDQRYMDGCPVLEVSDTAEDYEHLLRALYDGPIFGNNDREDFRVVSGILRLATKYLIDTLRTRALDHLAIAWPTSLKGWDTREDIARVFESETGQPRGLRYPSPIDIITLAQEVYAPSLLPAGFYDLSRYHFSQIFDPGQEQTRAILCCINPDTSLSMEDLQRLALGKEASSQAVPALIQSMSTQAQRSFPAYEQKRGAADGNDRRRWTGRGVCVSGAACRKDFTELIELATKHYLFDREQGCADPLYVAEELGQLKSAEFSECKACAYSLEAWAVRERDRLWKLVPGWFRLEVR
ncbi:uncharacterized protein PHACADRAFT_214031 [Phanerochaete carnosa HHB-10118-sp]|uniref:BTB domain-containing protein n=1 Tax=Phanerochaete carnosa (strain HHB-10118-sp) TaxID=650164 RepID=K5VGL8_PHACS|nr:uncharacterized protein PHACADRAFT_214031 [Phanerochaete carnosa HHB-10118-sp]EKM50333.1 hypothetical protein PHACADRAFT_214031 [Phanerochaete carnosa HHB-10118-sp]